MLKVIGTMSGTSCDGVDVGLLETDGEEYIKFLGGCTVDYDRTISEKLKNAYAIKDYKDIILLEKYLTECHARAITEFLCSQGLTHWEIDLIGFHGHTIFHDPQNAVTWQIGNPNLLAELTKISVISDFRRRDMAAGGQGAPLAPIFHKALAQTINKDQVVFLNIGGVSNITYIGGEKILASDVGPGNALIDDFVFQLIGFHYDKDGMLASSGDVNFDIIEQLKGDAFFHQLMPKSLDRNHFNYINLNNLKVEDGAATLSYFTAMAIAKGIETLGQSVARVIVCGGGRKNSAIMGWLQRMLTKIQVMNIDQLEIDGDLIEAYAFAYLAARSLKKLPISYPETTGISVPCSGGVITYK